MCVWFTHKLLSKVLQIGLVHSPYEEYVLRWEKFRSWWWCLALLLLVCVAELECCCRRLSHVWGQGDGCGPGMPGHGQLVPHQLLHLLLMWPGTEGQGLLQRARQSVLRGRLPLLRLPADGRKVCHLWPPHHGDGKSSVMFTKYSFRMSVQDFEPALHLSFCMFCFLDVL